MLERDIESYLVSRVLQCGGEVRKLRWIGRNKAPDRVVLLPDKSPVLVEVKSPAKVISFPSTAHERAQEREHIRLRKFGFRVEVVGTFEQVDELLA